LQHRVRHVHLLPVAVERQADIGFVIEVAAPKDRLEAERGGGV
jgi:hypothetical protein